MIILSCALGVTLPALAASFAFTTLPAPGAKQTVASRINAAGQIVTFPVPSAAQTVASGINAPGQIVGDFKDAGGKLHDLAPVENSTEHS